MGPSIGTRSAIDGEVNLRCWDAFVIGLQKQILCREIKEEEGKAVGVGLSLLVTQKEGKEDCGRWSYCQRGECRNKDSGVYSLRNLEL